MVAQPAVSGDRGTPCFPGAFIRAHGAPIASTGMDQTFNFRAAPVPLSRRLNPRAIAVGFVVFFTLAGLGSFSRWVIDSERRSVERASRAEASTALVATMSGTADATAPIDPIAGPLAIDGTARADARTALDAAREAASGSASFLDAGPGHLRPFESALIFVDGPSRAPGVVSVASTRTAWGAAVMGPSGTCYLLRFAPGDGVSYGSGETCTGTEALSAREPAW